jgi:hypothetical protein
MPLRKERTPLSLAAEPPASKPPVEERPMTSAMLEAGASAASSLSGDWLLAQPALGAGLSFGRQRTLWWGFVEAIGAAFGSRHHIVVAPGSTGALTTYDVAYRRADTSLRLGLGHGRGDAITSLVSLEAGVGFGHMATTSPVDPATASDRRTFWLAPGVELRSPLSAGFSLGLGLAVAWLPQAHRYLVRGVEAVDEGSAEARVRMGLVWETP